MGNTMIRKLCKNEAKWTDKSAKRHKHNFNVHAVARLKRPNGRSDFYDVMKCEYCNSFKCIPKEGSCTGFLPNGGNGQLPIIRLKTSHKYFISFKDAELE